MLGVMLLGWVLFDGAGVSSLARRVEPLRVVQTSLRESLGQLPPQGEKP